jgi:hypothetical protein
LGNDRPSRRRLGRTLVRIYLNLAAVPPSAATAALDAANRAGRLTDFSLRIQRHGRLESDRLLAFAGFAALSEADLRQWGLAALERVGAILVRRGPSDDELWIEEQIGVGVALHEQAAALWDHFAPSDLERATVASAELLGDAPMAESDHRQALAALGHAERHHVRALAILKAIGLLRRETSRRLGEDVVFSPYVWSTGAVQIAEFVRGLPSNEREVMSSLHREVAERPGISVERLGDPSLANMARKVGLIHATRVVTKHGDERAFAFSPALDNQLAPGRTDVAHDRKLFTAHILFGHRYGFAGTGRILDPLVLVRALIDRGQVGPATAIGTDYPLLEARGIVSVHPVEGTKMAHLRLVRTEVAEDALSLLEQSLGSSAPGTNTQAKSIQSLWVPGVSFVTPERDRALLAEVEPGAEAELLGSLVDELREAAARAVRGEDV